MAARSPARRPTRTFAVVTQIAAAVGAAFLVPTLVVSVNEFNTGTQAPWRWETLTLARDPGLPIDRSAVDGATGIESGVWTSGEIADWQVDVYGLAPASEIFSAELVAGRAARPGGREALVSSGFADHLGLVPGDAIELELASGTVVYGLAGTVDDHARTIYVDRESIAADLGAPGMANVVWTTGAGRVPDVGVAAWTSTADELAADDAASRDAIVAIFGAIGVVVAGVAALAVLSSLSVDLFERRRELATLQALGARRRRLRSVLLRELVPVGAIGVTAGLALGALGARGIIGSFEESNAVDIGVIDAVGAIPFIVAGAASALLLLVVTVVRTAVRRPVAVVLRGAS